MLEAGEAVPKGPSEAECRKDRPDALKPLALLHRPRYRPQMTGNSTLQDWFEKKLPQLVRKADFHLRPLKGEARDEAVAEVLAIAWSRFVRLEEQVRDYEELAGPVIAFSCKQVREGRRLAGAEPARDVTTKRTQQMMHFLREPMEALSAVTDNRATPADQAAFRADFHDWRSRFSPRDQKVMDDLAEGFTTSEAAVNHRITPARISQLRETFRRSWDETQAR